MAKQSKRIFDDKGSGMFQRSKGGCWFIRLRDARGRDRTLNLGKAKGEALRRAKIEIGAAVDRKLGRHDERAEKLQEELKRPIAEHVEAHHAHLVAKGNTPDHIRSIRTLIENAIGACEWGVLADIDPEQFDAYRTDIREQRGLSNATLNRNTRAVKQFTRWLTLRGKLAADPLIGVGMLNEAVTPRLVRGAFTDDELGKLVAAAHCETVTAPARFDADGRKTDNSRRFTIPGRGLLYQLAASTGLRLGEIRSLRVSDFHLGEDGPVVILPAMSSKRRTQDVQPLPADIVPGLLAFMATMHPQTQPWNSLPDSMGRVVAADCVAAGFDLLTPSGEIRDFHSLRATYITRLARANVPFATVQKLARHSSPVLTSKHYTKLGLVDTSGAVDSLPPIAASEGPAATAI